MKNINKRLDRAEQKAFKERSSVKVLWDKKEAEEYRKENKKGETVVEVTWI